MAVTDKIDIDKLTLNVLCKKYINQSIKTFLNQLIPFACLLKEK
jgi:hypothetical protein